jgi:hypothetical protein
MPQHGELFCGKHTRNLSNESNGPEQKQFGIKAAASYTPRQSPEASRSREITRD